MAPEIVLFDDPLDPRGWVLEPVRRRVAFAFPDVEWTVRAVGMVESWDAYDGAEVEGGRAGMAAACARLAEQYGMPIDEFLWFDDPPTSSWPACRAIAAAGLQDETADAVDGPVAARRLLRATREATFARRRSMSDERALETLVAGVPGLDGDAVAAALADGRADAAFEAAREAAAALDAPGVTRSGGRCELPAVLVRADGEARVVSGIADFAAYRETMAAVAGLDPVEGTPDVAAVLARFSPEGWVARAELEHLTGLGVAEVEAAAGDLVESGELLEERFAAEPFWRLAGYVEDDEESDGGDPRSSEVASDDAAATTGDDA